VEEEEERILVAHTDQGVIIRERIKDLKDLLKAYRSGLVRER
jgi:fructose-1,6-bisphosphatase